MEFINKNGEVNNGAHFENVVAQQLTANGFGPYLCKIAYCGDINILGNRRPISYWRELIWGE
jgi:hypothetical protein